MPFIARMKSLLPTSSITINWDGPRTTLAQPSPTVATILAEQRARIAALDEHITMFNAFEAFGSTSMQVKASRTPTFAWLPGRWWSSAARRVSRSRYTLARVTVFMCIGHWSRSWILKRGKPMQPGSLNYVRLSGFTSTRLVLKISRRYSERPGHTTANQV
jgi:hypothetical protein